MKSIYSFLKTQLIYLKIAVYGKFGFFLPILILQTFFPGASVKGEGGVRLATDVMIRNGKVEVL
ncbi:MAG: hypothetical protein ACTSRX_08700, partial [Promethearchaeota archaeon]